MDRIKSFVKERNAALLSLDKKKIIAYMRKYQETQPEQEDELIFWASVHKARLQITTMPESEKEISRIWLLSHGFKTDIFWDRLTHAHETGLPKC